MNKVVLVGRLTRDPDFHSTQNSCYARFSVAVDRKYKQDGQPTADFPSCLAWGKTAEFVDKYFKKGQRIGVEGRIQTGSYKGKDGNTVYTTDVVAESVEFVENKRDSQGGAAGQPAPPRTDDDGFMNIPAGIDEELPFN